MRERLKGDKEPEACQSERGVFRKDQFLSPYLRVCLNRSAQLSTEYLVILDDQQVLYQKERFFIFANQRVWQLEMILL